MNFVPSLAVSVIPLREFISADDMANGASAMFRTGLAIDNGALK
jgi:hypothetical protein